MRFVILLVPVALIACGGCGSGANAAPAVVATLSSGFNPRITSKVVASLLELKACVCCGCACAACISLNAAHARSVAACRYRSMGLSLPAKRLFHHTLDVK